MRVAAFLMLLALNDAVTTSVPALIRLKDGTIYRLKAPPHLTGGRFVFTTVEGGVYSLAEVEVDEVRLLTPTPNANAGPNPQDSHALGAIARQERRTHGKYTLLAPAPTPRPKKGAAKSSS